VGLDKNYYSKMRFFEINKGPLEVKAIDHGIENGCDYLVGAWIAKDYLANYTKSHY
jgi:hypothetical protein